MGEVILRRAAMCDAERLYNWRCDPITVAMSLGHPPPTFNAHIAWLAKRLADQTWRWWIAEVDRAPIGSLRLTQEPIWADIGLIVAPHARGQGYATAILCASFNVTPFPRLIGRIKPANLPSIYAHRRAGFIQRDDHQGLLVFTWPPSDQHTNT